MAKTDILTRLRTAYQTLALTGVTPSKRAVGRVAGAAGSTVDMYWHEITEEDDEPRQVQVKAYRRCLMCSSAFESKWVGHRVCGRCKGLETWQAGVPDCVVVMPF